MISKPFVAAFLAAGCIGAAAGGAYVAVRHNPTDSAALNQVPPPATVDSAPAKPVAESEAIVGTPAPVPPAAEAPIEKPTVAPPAPKRQAAASPARQTTRSTRRDRDVAINPGPRSPIATAPQERVSDPAPPIEAATQPHVTRSEPMPAVTPVADTAPPLPPAREFVQVVVPAAAVIGLHVETSLSSERARVEDPVEARVSRDVSEDGRIAIPAGTRALGSVILVERGGKIKERARLGVRFHTLVFADGTTLPIRTDAIFREGDSPGNESAKKIGGATVGGAILGAILGGGKGAAIGGAAGAAGGTAAVMAGDRNAASLSAGTIVTVRLSEPVTVDVEKRDREIQR